MSVNAVPPAVSPTSEPARANLGRGTLAALLTIPVGVVVWVVLWSFGFIASLVGALVAYLALRLYLRGAGLVSRTGALIVLAVTAVTLLLAFFSGIVLDAAQGLGEVSGLGAWGAFTHGEFWPTLGTLLPEALPDYLPDFAWAVGFGALGSFTTLRGAFAAARVSAAPVPSDDDRPAAQEPPAPEAQAAPGTV
ncbi:hypothetical protein [Actinotalea sp. K2]|uniref:hypothetical protein n=1 Tax=Actinotalea sp. K2 TaxID=2939438 RepID=UPI002017F042|nr:hypothetical protein [Actinotalea sp. K2]MCL3861123.1 hypothetical protein [Actinotalea sp. K2]